MLRQAFHRALGAAAILLPALLPATAAHAQATNACASANLISPGTYTGTTVGQTRDGADGCSGTGPDVWFKYVPDQNYSLSLSTCSSASFDTVLSLHRGCPGNTSNIVACNDDACINNRSELAVNVTAGQTYLIRVGGWNGAAGTFTLTVAVSPPVIIPGAAAGPDVTVGFVYDIARQGTGTFSGQAVTAYAVGTDSCNRGDTPVLWISETNQHPVIAQNMFRYKDGSFRQIGMSWLKHGFLSTNSSSCGTCVIPPLGGDQLGVNCSDIYDSGLNGSQSNLGPRNQVNATTGAFPYPFSAPAWGTSIDRRLQTFTADINPAVNAGASYVVDTQYVTADDALANNGRNNVSWRPITIASSTTSPVFSGPTRQQQPAIFAWKEFDPQVTLVPLEYDDNGVRVRFWLGARATPLAGGAGWRYEYAVYNINSHRSARALQVPVAGPAPTNALFSAPRYHSGEPHSNTPWTNSFDGASLAFAGPEYTPANQLTANALRWGTMYTFGFDSTVPPVSGAVTLRLFRPAASPAGGPGFLVARNVPAPMAAPLCVADIVDIGTTSGPDGALTVDDYTTFINALAGDELLADVVSIGGFPPPDGAITVDDYTSFLNGFAGDCQ